MHAWWAMSRLSILNFHSLYAFGTPLVHYVWNNIGGIMASALASSAVDCWFEPRTGQTKDYKIDICCFSAKHAALRRKSKDWLVRNQNNVSEWSDLSTRGLLFQWASTIKIQLTVSTKRTSSSPHWKVNSSNHDIAEKLNNNHSVITYCCCKVCLSYLYRNDLHSFKKLSFYLYINPFPFGAGVVVVVW
jgi:hypothetical protein